MLQDLIQPIALITFIAALVTKPIRSLCIYAIVLFSYTQLWTIPISTVDFTVSRIVILAVFLNVVFRTSLVYKFRWNVMDTAVMLFFILRFYAYYQTMPSEVVIQREGGYFLDVILPYYMGRVIIRDVSDIVTLFKTLVILGIPLAFLTMYQSVTGVNFIGEASRSMRRGFYRANLVFGDYISCGLFFSGLIAIAYSIRPYRVFTAYKTYLITIIFILAGLATVSSAPLFSAVISLSIIYMFPIRHRFPVFLGCVALWCAFLEFYSNRHFYEVLTELSFSSETSYYRIGLINEAFGGGMKDHWWFGYGYVGIGPGSFNQNFKWRYIDLVNLYIYYLARTGLFGLIPFLTINVMLYRNLIKAHREARVEEQYLIWCLTGLVIGWNISMMTVSAMAQIDTFLFLIIAISYNLRFIAVQEREAFAEEENEAEAEGLQPAGGIGVLSPSGGVAP